VDRGISHELVRHRVASFCLSGDSEVISYASKISCSCKRWTIKQLYDWSLDYHKSGKLKLINLRSVDDNNIIVANKITKIVYSGPQIVYEVITECGRKIKATLKHKFKTIDGYKKLGQLLVGDYIYANGTPAYQDKEWITELYINQKKTRPEVAKLAGVSDACLGVWIRKLGIKKPLSCRINHKAGHGIKGMFSEEEKQNISKRMSGSNNPGWEGDDVSDNGARLRANKMYHPDKCSLCNKTINLERHHIDKNPKNNNKNNIKYLCQQHHHAVHHKATKIVYQTKIISITKIGVEDTYDIEMKAPYHNFVANGLVVHNSQESTRYCDYSPTGKKNLGITFVIPPWIKESIDGEFKGNTYSQHLSYPVETCIWLNSMLTAEESYNGLIQHGWKPEQARSVLPHSLKTEIIITANGHEWLHIFKLRCAEAAHPQMREVMQPLEKELVPKLFGQYLGVDSE
jgi:thymidylate synthase (FAD)